MKKILEKFIAKLLIAVLFLSVFGIYSSITESTAEAAELPIVNEAQVTDRVKELARLLEVNNGTLDEGSGVLFTANGKACGHATGNAGDCKNCFNSYVVNTKGNWFHTKFGYTIDPELLPGHYSAPSGSLTNKAWTCAGFANFALWYIAKADNTSDVYRDLLGTQGAKFTYSNLQKFDIRIGDVLRVPELNHSFMFLEYVGDSAIKVLDCNWVNKDANKIAQVKIHKINLNSSYTMAITRARNYEPGEREQIQGKTYGTLDLSATSYNAYNVGLNAEMYADKAYPIYHGAKLEILDKVTNTKGNEVYYVYSPDLGMKCYVSAKYVKVTETPTPSNPIGDFVTRLYTLCLNRTPDAVGLDDWCTKLSSGTSTGTEVAHGFVFSDEFTKAGYSDEEFVRFMYRIFLGREADSAGLNDWLNRMHNQGYGREAVFNGFSQSTEFNSICTEYCIVRGSAVGKVSDDISSFVIRFYQVCLGRDADSTGLEYWASQLKEKTVSAAEVAYGFVFSPEFLNKNYDDATFVTYMYQAFLDRSADSVGLADWTANLQNGSTREDVFYGFVGSNEFAGICEEYGITRDGEEDVPEKPDDTTGFIAWDEAGLEDGAIVWGDSNLEKAMREITRITDRDIMLSDVWEITSLTLDDNEIENIDALSVLWNLTEIELRYNRIENISMLSLLPNLQRLNLCGNPIRGDELKSLLNFKNLVCLDLGNNGLIGEDVAFLAELDNLKQLYLGYNNIMDIGVLAEMTGLTHLDLCGNNISDISALSGLTNLVYLSLWWNCISDVTPLSGLSKLTYLNLSDNAIGDICALLGLKDMKTLYLGLNSEIDDISALSEMKKLSSLSISNTGVTDISVLRNLRELVQVSLVNNDISDYSPVAHVPNVQR